MKMIYRNKDELQSDRISPTSRKAIAVSVANIRAIASIACYRAALALTH
jgi:hypothetical protein